MRDHFRGYYKPTAEELESMWTEGTIVLDTNALLNLYRYTAATRDDFVAVLNSVQERLWIPHQVGLEFQRRRLDVIDQQEKAFDDIEAALTSAGNSVEKELNRFRRHPSLSSPSVTKTMRDALESVRGALNESRVGHAQNAISTHGEDPILDLITQLYAGKVGDPFSEDVLAQLYEEGATRYEKMTPPGFKDQEKPEPNRYGDLVLWKQMLGRAQATKQSALFVTDDGKEDWWYQFKGKTMGPRVELIEEFFAASGQRIHFYSPEQFLKFAKDRSGSAIRDESLGEVEQLSNEKSSARAMSVMQSHREQLLRQLEQTASYLRRQARTQDPGGPRGSAERLIDAGQRELRELQSQFERLERQHELLDNVVATAQGGERDSALLAIGRIEVEIEQTRLAMETVESRLTRTLRAAESRPESRRGAIEELEERMFALQRELNETERAMSELG